MLSLEDERQITAVILRYADGIDRRDWPRLRSCFTEDVTIDFGDFVGGQWSGIEAIMNFMVLAHEELGATLHRMTNIMASGDAERATARTYVDAFLTPKAGGEVQRGIGYYDDELVRTTDGWKLKCRRITVLEASEGLARNIKETWS